MLTYNFTEIGSDSMYEYLYRCIKDDILHGVLSAGTKLPSKRIFAKNLGISVITVENAYGQLMAEGYIYSIPKKGFYVCELKEIYMNNMISEEEDMEEDTQTKLISMDQEEKEYFADFSNNQTDTDVFPFSIWSKTMREVMNGNQEQLMTNAPGAGIMELREAIVKYLKQFRGMQVKAEQIVVGAGTDYLYGLLVQLLGRQVIYGVENPGYHKIAKIFEQMNAPYCYIDVDQDGVSAQKLEEKEVDVIHISPSHHFPTGIVMPISRRYELLGWASRKEGRYIIEDDYDSELRLTGKPIPTLQSIDVSDQVIYINTFTKTLCSTVRISYMVLPEPLLRKFYENLGFYSCTVSNFEQYILARFMENGSFEKHLNRLRNYYQNKRDRIMEAFREKPLGERITITEEDAGVHFLMKIHTEKKEEDMIADVKKKGIKLVPISQYYQGEKKHFDNTYVMNYSSIKMERVQEIASKLLLALT
ncbi:MAG: PLP-dependent aminotransferase family protein [Eubacteriales bacterium]|nr:PLP-dependent aminotransferase family protein [Eubacteriales bacterium]